MGLFNESLSGMESLVLGGILVGLAGLTFILILLIVGVWIYTSLAWVSIGKKLNYKYPWIAWIPFARNAMIFQMGKFPWPLVFLWLIPIIGWVTIGVLTIISSWRIFEKRKYPGWLAVIPVGMIIPFLSFISTLAYWVILGFVAWKDLDRKQKSSLVVPKEKSSNKKPIRKKK